MESCSIHNTSDNVVQCDYCSVKICDIFTSTECNKMCVPCAEGRNYTINLCNKCAYLCPLCKENPLCEDCYEDGCDCGVITCGCDCDCD